MCLLEMIFAHPITRVAWHRPFGRRVRICWKIKIVSKKACIFSEGILDVSPGGQTDRSSAEIDAGIVSLPLLFRSDA